MTYRPSFGLQAMVDALSRAAHDGETLSLGELIDQLEHAPPDAPVEFRGPGLDGCVPDGFDSWRGIYADLALDYTTVLLIVDSWAEVDQ